MSTMSNHKEHEKHRRSDLKNLPSEVLLKARSTLVSLVKSKQEPQRKPSEKKARMKSSRSEPEFDRKVKRRSRVDEPRDHTVQRPRPLSVGAMKRYEDEMNFHSVNYKELHPKEATLKRQFDSSDDVCVPSRLVIPAVERREVEPDVSERPRKKLSFREPEIVGSASATLGRSSKLMGVNSLHRRPNKLSIRSEMHSSLDGLDSDLESQAMKIVRTVGQAFEVCHKMQANPRDPAPSTSSAPDEPPAEDHASDPAPPKEAASECGSSEPASASASRVAEESRATPRPKHLDLLPPPPLPPPQKEGKRSAQVTKPVPSINLPELPECVTTVDTHNLSEGDTATPLSAQHHVQLLHERLEQQAQQTRAAVAQLLLLRDQLAAEQAARCEAQARTHQLLVHNKELLEHIAALVAHLQDKEKGNSRPISAQQLTLLPQMRAEAGTSEAGGTETVSFCNGNCRPFNGDALIEFIAQSNQINQNVENNNIDLSNCRPEAPAADKLDPPGSSPGLGNMTNDQIQNYLVSKFRDMAFPNGADRPSMNKHFYQNCKAFPHIPPLSHHCSNSDLASLLRQQCDKSSSSDELGGVAQAMSLGHSQNSLCSTSQPTTSKDSSPDSSSDEAVPFIMPLSHNGTLTATGEDGRVRLIVPVSPSSSAAGLAEHTPAPNARLAPPSTTLQVPGAMPAPAAPITRSTSEKVPNRSEMMTALRSQWTRHTTK